MELSDAEPLVFPAVKSWRQATLPSPSILTTCILRVRVQPLTNITNIRPSAAQTQPLILGTASLETGTVSVSQRLGHVTVKSPTENNVSLHFRSAATMFRQIRHSIQIICGLLTRRL